MELREIYFARIWLFSETFPFVVAWDTQQGEDIVAQKFGKENKERILLGAEKYIQQGKIIYQNSFLQLTRKGKFLADGIAADLFC